MEDNHPTFEGIDFTAMGSDADFKEDSVRELLCLPLLRALGYDNEQAAIVRSKMLSNPFVMIGKKRVAVRLIPDYVMKVGKRYAWVLECKSPKHSVTDEDNVGQAYSYAMSYEIRAKFFALCNGTEFALYRTDGDGKPILHFQMKDICEYWKMLHKTLSPNYFKDNVEVVVQEHSRDVKTNADFDYRNRPLPKTIPNLRHTTKRHWGVHGYFTKQPWNVVAAYIKNYSQQGDLVLDPYGGSGVTAIEALLMGRKAINIDINPLAVFLVDALLAPVKLEELKEAYEQVRDTYIKEAPQTDAQVEKLLTKYKLPPNLPLPKDSDVPYVHELFTQRQMAELALLRAIIRRQEDENIKKTLMLVFSGILTRYNLTFFINSWKRGNASPFWVYRYRISPNPSTEDILDLLRKRFKAVSAAKKELNSERYCANYSVGLEDFQNIKGSATNMSMVETESVDYIYTDPPYAANIQYLDLSAMWNAWLDLKVSDEDYKLEAIEDGLLEKSREEYKRLISKSIEEMFRVLKWDRWLSFVFAHKDPWYWHLITETAEKCGFEYMGAVAQACKGNFHEWQHPFTVLTGQLIINFRKVRTPKTLLMANVGMDMGQIIMQSIEGIIAKDDGATLEQINNELIKQGLEMGFLHLLAKEYKDIVPLLRANFDYDVHEKKYVIRAGEPFKTNVPLEKRIKYYLISYLRVAEREGRIPSLNEIVMEIMPRLKNGVTPDEDSILAVLEVIGERVGENGWRLHKEGEEQKMLEF